VKISERKYWTIDEVKELQAAIELSEHGRKPVIYRGQLVWLRGLATFTFHHGGDFLTVDGLEIMSARSSS